MDIDCIKPGTSKQLLSNMTSGHACVEKMDFSAGTCENEGENNRQTNFDDEVLVISSDDSDITSLEEMNETRAPRTSSVIVAVNNSDCLASSESNCRSLILNTKNIHQVVEENVGLKKILFRNYYLEPISFLLLLHDYGLELKLSKLIEDFGGLVYCSVNDIDDYTVVLVKDESLHWAYWGPVFKVSYIAACIEAKKIINISPFFKASIKPKFTKDLDYMRVVYLKKSTWDNLCADLVSPNKTISESRVHDSDSDNDVEMVPLKASNSNTNNIVEKRVSKHTRLLYTRKEDEDIIKYIVKRKGYNNVKGVAFWKKMESKEICPRRTWQSMKEHFRKKLVCNLSSFKFLSENEKYLLEKSCV